MPLEDQVSQDEPALAAREEAVRKPPAVYFDRYTSTQSHPDHDRNSPREGLACAF
jgi:hypothetical protein